MIIISWTDAFTFALIYVGAKYLFDEVVPPYLKITGQMIGMAIYWGGAGILAPIIFGVISDFFTIDISLFILSILGVISFLLALQYKKNCETKRREY